MSDINSIGFTRAQREKQRVNVAILGAGRIASHMAETLMQMNAHPSLSNIINPYAVASRSLDRAKKLAHRYRITKAYGSYQDLLCDQKVDLVYIATPHSLHAEQATSCLQAGKNVLVEKSFTLNARQANEVLSLARARGLLCAEAIWTRYMPSCKILHDILSSGQLGHIRAASANLCYPTTSKTRMTDPSLGGGALLDVGVYALNFLDMVFQAEPVKTIHSTASLYATGVDESNSTTLIYRNGALGIAVSSMSVSSDRTGTIWGSKGYAVCYNINNIQKIETYNTDHQLLHTYEMPPQITGYEYEVEAAAQAILAGHVECPQMPHADTMRLMEQMDSIRQLCGVHYPGEN